MAETAPRLPLSQTEAAALGLAALGHVALVAALVWLKPADPPPPPPSRMAVSLTSETGLISTATDPQPDAALDAGPVVGDMDPLPEPEPISLARAQALPNPALRSQTKPLTPQAKPATRPPVRPPSNTGPPRPGTNPGSSSFDNAFRDGIPDGGKGKDKSPPAQATGQQKSAWQNSVKARIQGPWQRCPISGLDLESLRMVVPFTLDRQGNVLSIGEPRISGQSPANRSQIAPFRACAEKAIRLGAPYTSLPPEYYEQWKPREIIFSKGRVQ